MSIAHVIKPLSFVNSSTFKTNRALSDSSIVLVLRVLHRELCFVHGIILKCFDILLRVHFHASTIAVICILDLALKVLVSVFFDSSLQVVHVDLLNSFVVAVVLASNTLEMRGDLT